MLGILNTICRYQVASHRDHRHTQTLIQTRQGASIHLASVNHGLLMPVEIAPGCMRLIADAHRKSPPSNEAIRT